MRSQNSICTSGNEEIIEIVASGMPDFKATMHQSPVSAAAPPQSLLVGELTALPQTA